MRSLLLLLLSPLFSSAQFFKQDIDRCKQQAQQVTIIRDNWGIPHIYGKKDADAVFGLMYAQCEDDFNRVEMNYIEKLGRMSEVKGESELANDLYTQLILDDGNAKLFYNAAQVWLKQLLDAWADGINYYLYTHPEVKPALLHHFEPWYPLLWTDGSIGAINTGEITPLDVNEFYLQGNPLTINKQIKSEAPVTGSNGFAIAPSRSASGNALLYINPHVTFYFRPEVHMVSEEGLNVYGAVTWGQFFIYQGFNEHCGWMHTSSDVDVADLYMEQVKIKYDPKLKSGLPETGPWYESDSIGYTLYSGQKLFPVYEKKITLRYKKGTGTGSRSVVMYKTGRGPVMGRRNGRWVSVRHFNQSLNGLVQSWKRTRSAGFSDYEEVMEMKGNTSNNTVFADDKGNIAYWHGNFVPRRDSQFNFSKPVEGANYDTRWNDSHTLDEIVHVYNPASGWIQNCNSTPFTVAGSSSPKKADYPAYMAPDGENYRGINAVRLLSAENKFTIDKLIATGYDRHLAAFEPLIPALVKAYEQNIDFYNALAAPIEILKAWDFQCSENSIATTLAIEWGEKLIPKMPKGYDDSSYHYVDNIRRTTEFLATASAKDLLDPLLKVLEELYKNNGTWKMEWGAINRYQRISGDIDQRYNDQQPSIPVGFASSTWGMLPSYTSKYFPGTTKRYGVNGNSFICAVEFGKKVRAKSLLAGGESGNPASKHFNDQMEMYAKGKFKDVLFYKEDVLKHVESKYHPGESSK